MAYYNNKNYSKPRYSQVEKIAYRCGQVKRGLTNPNSKITQSYNNGLKGFKSNTKTLF